jgi:predicted phage gp36 major capsid-like protein
LTVYVVVLRRPCAACAIDAQARRLDEITLKAARPALGSEPNGRVRSGALEHKAAFEAYVRTGELARRRTARAD